MKPLLKIKNIRNMKKIFLVLFLLGVCISGRAQKHEFFASANIVSYFHEKNEMTVPDEDSPYVSKSIDWNTCYTRELTYGGLNIGYLNNLYTDFAVGGVVSYMRTKRHGTHFWCLSLENTLSYLAVMPIIRKKWWQNEKWSLYSQAGGGALIRIGSRAWDTYYKKEIDYKVDKSGPVKLAYHLSVIGADFKFTKEWSVFGEAGFGCMGIVNVGIRYSL